MSSADNWTDESLALHSVLLRCVKKGNDFPAGPSSPGSSVISSTLFSPDLHRISRRAMSAYWVLILDIYRRKIFEDFRLYIREDLSMGDLVTPARS